MRILRLFVLAAAAVAAVGIPATARAQVYISLVAPPLMPTYDQPALTQPGMIWTPGYWAWGPAGYYWVPGTWTYPPSSGLYWTPGYWGMNTGGSGYMWNPGYWGPSVGYYGGINYGYGYYGNGYTGGGWQGNVFRYNTAVTRVNPTYVRNVYVNKTVVVHNVNRYSYNGPGGERMRPNATQIAYAKQHHVGLTSVQRAHIQEASQDRNLYAKVNHGRPAQAAVARPYSTTNRPSNFKPLTAADKSSASAPKAQPKPVSHPPEKMHPNNPPAAKPPAAKAPAAKPPAAAHPAPKEPMHANNKPPAQSAPKQPKPASHPQSNAKPQGGKPPANAGGKPPANGGGKQPQGKATHKPA
ncbi:MAG TPA: YXWGXW repeat-containing protein [Candidatus Tumulicola sp.]|nr:YXWGXW repeat-containing protein [Candidatus Tumulicola sp.]